MKRTCKPKAKAPKTTKPKVTSAEALRLDKIAEYTGAAWVGAISLRVRELADELGRFDNLLVHPDKRAAALVLRMILDAGAVGRLIKLVNEAEELLPSLLQPDVVDRIPDLVGACFDAAEGMPAILEPAKKGDRRDDAS